MKRTSYATLYYDVKDELATVTARAERAEAERDDWKQCARNAETLSESQKRRIEQLDHELQCAGADAQAAILAASDVSRRAEARVTELKAQLAEAGRRVIELEARLEEVGWHPVTEALPTANWYFTYSPSWDDVPRHEYFNGKGWGTAGEDEPPEWWMVIPPLPDNEVQS